MNEVNILREQTEIEFYVNIQFLPHRERTALPLGRYISECCVGKQTLFFCVYHAQNTKE
jgi:hypothetical protein